MLSIKKLYSYIIGYVNITVEGVFLERFINICIRKRIYLWNSKRDTSIILHTNISVIDFKNIREIARKTRLSCKNE